jgi:hypothetical protein
MVTIVPKTLEQGAIMDKIDLIIDALTNCSAFQPKKYYEIDKALAAARELKLELAKPEQEPRKEWVGLTEDEQYQIVTQCGAMSADWQDFVVAVEQTLKDKNDTI